MTTKCQVPFCGGPAEFETSSKEEDEHVWCCSFHAMRRQVLWPGFMWRRVGAVAWETKRLAGPREVTS